MENSSLYRLSVIIPARTSRAQIARSVESVFRAKDSIGTEVIVVTLDDETGEIDHLRRQFAPEIQSGRLSISVVDAGEKVFVNLRTEGVERSQGVFLTFIEPGDRFSPDRLEKLAPRLDRHDLIAEVEEGSLSPAETTESFFQSWSPKLISRTLVIRRTLLYSVGGLRIGLFSSDFDLWARARLYLERQNEADRILLVDQERTLLSDESGLLAPLALPASIRKGANQVKELGTLLRIAPQLSFGHLPRLLGEIKDRSKNLFRGKK